MDTILDKIKLGKKPKIFRGLSNRKRPSSDDASSQLEPTFPGASGQGSYSYRQDAAAEGLNYYR